MKMYGCMERMESSQLHATTIEKNRGEKNSRRGGENREQTSAKASAAAITNLPAKPSVFICSMCVSKTLHEHFRIQVFYYRGCSSNKAMSKLHKSSIETSGWRLQLDHTSCETRQHTDVLVPWVLSSHYSIITGLFSDSLVGLGPSLNLALTLISTTHL